MSFLGVLLVVSCMAAVWWRVVRVGRGFGVGLGWLHWFGISSAFLVGLVMFAALDADGAWYMVTLVLVGGVVWLWVDDLMNALERWARPKPASAPVPHVRTTTSAPGALSSLSRQEKRIKANVDTVYLPDRVAFTYASRDTGIKHRVVNVNKVMPFDEPPKFTGWCELANSVKTFRLDRIEGDVVRQDTGEVMAAADWFWSLKPTA